LLYQYDEAFRKYFKVKVEFDGEMDRTPENCLKLAQFIASYTKEHQLLSFSRQAVRRMVDYSAQLAGHHQKLSTRFNQLIELIVEAEMFARQSGAKLVNEEHIQQALHARDNRSGMIKEKVLEKILDGTIMVDTQGERIGQINGLSVSKIGDLTFGQPHRITARTYVGRRGVVNVERETAMSGQIHSKGVLILSGYLAGEFAQEQPLSMSATLVFEQTYSVVDGDSASSTELYALLSSLAGLPIDQGSPSAVSMKK
jgi:predicted ATP-dependent protease